MNTNRSNVTENAFANIDNEKFSKNFDHVFNRENCKCEECEKDTFECFECGKRTPQKETVRVICLKCQEDKGVLDIRASD